jgi:hypothetical protein
MSLSWRPEERMRSSRPGIAGARSVALFLLGVVAFNPPLLAIFNVDTPILGVPLLYLYVFLAWGVLIALVRLAARSGREPPRPDTANR